MAAEKAHGRRAEVLLRQHALALGGAFRLRNVVLLLLVFQTTSIVLLMRYSRTRASDGAPYLSSVAVLLAELLKLPICLAMTCATAGGLATLRDELLLHRRETLQCAVPAFAYTVQGNLLFFALACLEAPTYQVAYQTKTLFTALFSRLLLGRAIQPSQWLAVALLSIGTALVSDLRPAPRASAQPGSPLAGLAAVLGAAVLSASSSVYFERLLKKPAASAAAAAASLWVRNIQLGLFAAPLALLTVLANDGARVAEHGWLAGFDAVVWLIVLLNGLGGLLVAATMKYADNVVKCFAAALAILSGTVLSVPIFGFHLSFLFLLGSGCTIVATILYAWAPPLWSREPQLEAEGSSGGFPSSGQTALQEMQASSEAFQEKLPLFSAQYGSRT
ncbi:hypothetical protein AB1Y20_010393 [Prymnesium parvum]|uniref:UDP-galactose transporter n=1 Tax=Prymnesium parvum TaxID=97485 RepID=A0AB34IPJ4_PRYPA